MIQQELNRLVFIDALRGLCAISAWMLATLSFRFAELPAIEFGKRVKKLMEAK